MSRPTLASDERGMLSIASLFAVLGLAVGFALVGNISKTVATKLEAQNAADAAAYAASVEMARGMNAVTAANHMIGELQALVVIHHSLGGDELDGTRPVRRTPAHIQRSLETSHRLAQLASKGVPKPIFFDQVKQEPRVGAAIYDSRVNLKRVMGHAYYSHMIGALLVQLRPIPFIGWILAILGAIIVAAAMVFEGKVGQEWLTLDALEVGARALKPVSVLVREVVVPGLYTYSCGVAGSIPGQHDAISIPGVSAYKAETAAEELGKSHKVEATLFPGLTKNTSFPLLALPVTPEPNNLPDPKKSQLVRASTPWVQKWRTGWLKFGEDALMLSRFKIYYKEWSDTFTLKLAQRAKRDTLAAAEPKPRNPIKINLLILRDLDLRASDKLDEPWTRADGSSRADDLFGTMAFARREAPGIAALGYFRQPNPDGVVAYAQGMIYNANPQPRRGTKRPDWQLPVAWDTLNWVNSVPEYPGPPFRGEDPPIPDVPLPEIRINWRAKLVPTTRLMKSVLWQRGELGEVLRRTPFFLPNLPNTH